MPTKIRVVLDTNVFVSGLISPSGSPGQILKLARENRFTLVTSSEINQEILEVLNRPRIRDKYDLHQEIFDIAFVLSEIAEVVSDLPRVKISKDPDDDKFIATAIAGVAHYLVTGDKKDLLHISEFKGIPIISPEEFLSIVNKAKRKVKKK